MRLYSLPTLNGLRRLTKIASSCLTSNSYFYHVSFFQHPCCIALCSLRHIWLLIPLFLEGQREERQNRPKCRTTTQVFGPSDDKYIRKQCVFLHEQYQSDKEEDALECGIPSEKEARLKEGKIVSKPVARPFRPRLITLHPVGNGWSQCSEIIGMGMRICMK